MMEDGPTQAQAGKVCDGKMMEGLARIGIITTKTTDGSWQVLGTRHCTIGTKCSIIGQRLQV